MNNKKLRMPIIFKKNDLYINFDKEQYNMIIVTGITGSGKSYTSQKLSQKYKLPVICFDCIYSYKQDKPETKLEKKLLKQFFYKYPEYKNAKELVKYGRKVKEKLLEINDNFYDLVLDYLKTNNIKIIFDGACFCNDVSFEKFKNERIIVKRTPFLKVIYQRTIRCIKRTKGTPRRFVKFLKDIKYTILHLNEWYKAIDGFLRKIETITGNNYE